MIVGILVALIGVTIGASIQQIMLLGRARRLRATQQAFRFHAIRDELQALALSGQVRQDDPVYGFVMWSANLREKLTHGPETIGPDSTSAKPSSKTRPWRWGAKWRVSISTLESL